MSTFARATPVPTATTRPASTPRREPKRVATAIGATAAQTVVINGVVALSNCASDRIHGDVSMSAVVSTRSKITSQRCRPFSRMYAKLDTTDHTAITPMTSQPSHGRWKPVWCAIATASANNHVTTRSTTTPRHSGVAGSRVG